MEIQKTHIGKLIRHPHCAATHFSTPKIILKKWTCFLRRKIERNYISRNAKISLTRLTNMNNLKIQYLKEAYLDIQDWHFLKLNKYTQAKLTHSEQTCGYLAF